VEVGEDPVETLTRELHEEWGLTPERTQIEALVCTPNRLVLLIGSVWVAAGAEVVRDAEHDAHAWWAPDPDDWPAEASPALGYMARMLA
ncbi:MAG: 8-oxo-dGTP diphosphatase, partial [Solirubrobacteraceae bacterium]|nr:8-oxo-dGTP diphosphatase [Solirubrobacteraceae bacterium]